MSGATGQPQSGSGVAGREIVAIVVASPLTQNIFDRIGVELISERYRVFIIDCLGWIREKNQRIYYQKVNYADLVEVGDEREFGEVFNNIHPRFVIDFIGRGGCTRAIQEVCRNHDAVYIMQLLTPAPHPVSTSNLRYSLSQHPIKTFMKAVQYLGRKFGRLEPLPPDVALLAGDASSSDWSNAAVARIQTATPDFFELKKIQQKIAKTGFGFDALAKDGYILFVDDCLAMSFDYVLGNYSRVFEVDEYFSLVREFFDKIEKHFGLPVVIAAHPNGREFPEYKCLFGDRNVFFGSTAELVWGCKFVISHFSSAISFAILLRKKILLLSADQLKGTAPGAMIDYISRQLQCTQIMIRDANCKSKLAEFEKTEIIESNYLAYQKKYIVNTSAPGEHPYDNLLKYLSARFVGD